MKKVLLTTTALVFTAGFAAAEGHSAASITISGEAVAGVKFVEDAPEEATQFVELDFGIAGKTTTDGGLEVGASFDLDIDTSSTAASITDEEVYLSAGGITLTMGEVGSAADSILANIGDVGFDGIGIDDTAETFFDVTTQNIHVKGEFGAITVVATGNMDESGAPASDDYGIAANYDAGTFSVGAGFANNTDEAALVEDIEVFVLSGSVTAAGADINLFFHTADSDDFAESVSGYGASVSYPMGALTLVGSVGATDLDDDEADFGVGASYDLGGGVSLAGGIGQRDPLADGEMITVADFGIKMKF